MAHLSDEIKPVFFIVLLCAWILVYCFTMWRAVGGATARDFDLDLTDTTPAAQVGNGLPRAPQNPLR